MKTVYKGYLLGVICSIALLGMLSLPIFHVLRMPGALHYGHQTLACKACHQRAKGSLRQQIQANVFYFLGLRATSVAFRFVTPTNEDCLACHQREEDRHAVYRFNEPRFSEVRQAIQPQLCQSCHQQHKGAMFTADAENCRYCHKEMRLKTDPLEIPHVDLIRQEKWQHCLACHDFHGNHQMDVPINSKNMINPKKLKHYLEGNKKSDPYASEKIVPAKEIRYENEATQTKKTTQSH